jgi:predicted nucleic acid-binding protein
MYLLNFSWNAQDALWETLESGLLRVFTLDEQDSGRMREPMKKYRDPPMDFADATLVRVAERERIKRVFTVDRWDFGVYRPKHIKRFQLIP